MKHQETKSDFKVGCQVYWMVGGSKRSGEVVDIYKSGKASGLSIRANRENDRVLVIRQDDGHIVMKLESDVVMKVNTD